MLHQAEFEMGSFTEIPFDLSTNLLFERFGIQAGKDRVEELEGLIGEVKRIGKPKALYKVSFIEAKGDDTVKFDGVTFRSRTLRKNLDEIERVFPFVVTCGTEIDGIDIGQGDPEKEEWINGIKGALVMASIYFLMDRIAEKYKLPKLSYMGPGQGDASMWPYEQLRELYSIYGNAEALIGVRLTASLLMEPLASAAGIFFPAEVDFQACQLCHREVCDFRKAPFDKDLWASIHQD